MARENCPKCGKGKHQLNRCAACGFQRLRLGNQNKIPKVAKPAKPVATGVALGKKTARSKAPKRKVFRHKKYPCGGSVMYGLIHKTASRKWHHVK